MREPIIPTRSRSSIAADVSDELADSSVPHRPSPTAGSVAGSLLYSVDRLDPLIAVTVLAGLFGAVLAPSLLPAREALIEPGTALRTD